MNFSYENLRRCTVAVDLGADRTRVYLKQAGIVVDEPSVVAVNTRSGALIAVGAPAERMTGRTPPFIKVVRPVADGTVNDVQMAQRMVRALVGEKVRRAWRYRPLVRAAVCVPHEADPLGQRAAAQTLAGLGCRRVELVDGLVAAAVGCGLPVEQPEATMIVLFGAQTTQVAVLSLGSIVAATCVPVGGETLDLAIGRHVRNRYRLTLPGEAVRALHQQTTDESGRFPAEPGAILVHGRDMATGLARTVQMDAHEVHAAVHGPIMTVLDAIRGVLHRCAPDLVADLVDHGIMLAGSSALLPGLDERLRQATSMTVRVADAPASSAVKGVAAMIEGRVRPLQLHVDVAP
ncbi:rod shape-determining protein [Streptomyces sp. JJ66]|uniref:rod shape-determining protein n=1 Tax=Streptomyces sp. JJ66 TaxID=2803843 RepID=UPI001C592473|nr:rod shape-determining protein [Streptomyces sp. JJ66]MBW1604214.1 rod shape-determining protein [Streptomyces sp. JJ66]